MTDVKVITSDNPKPIAHYSEATLADGIIFPAGQLASDFKTGVPPEARKHPNFPFYGSDIKLQTHFILKNLKRTFEAAGSLARQCRQGAGLPHRPARLRGVR